MTPHVSGTLVFEHRRLFEERFGDELVTRAFSSLRGEDRTEVVEATPGSWVRLEAFEAAYAAVASACNRDVESLHFEIGRIGVERTFSTVWRVLLRVTTDNALVTRTPIIFSKSYDCGQLRSKIDQPGRAELVLEGWPGVGDFPLRSLRNGVVTVLRLAGRGDPECRVVRKTTDGAELTASWRV